MSNEIKVKELNEKLFKYRKKYIKALNEDFDGDYTKYLNRIKPIIDKIDKIEHELSLGFEIVWLDMPQNSDLMTKETFISFVNENIYVDYDGHGYYSNGIKMSNIIVYPSDIKKGRIREDFTHISWFNI